MLVLSLIGAVLLLFGMRYFLWGHKGIGSVVVIYTDGTEFARYPLTENAEIVVEQKSGRNVLCIEDGKVFMREADCPKQECVGMGKINRIEQTIVCLPHRVVVEIRPDS